MEREETQEIIDKFEQYMDKKGITIEDKYWICKMMFENVDQSVKDYFFGDDDEPEEDDLDDIDEFDQEEIEPQPKARPKPVTKTDDDIIAEAERKHKTRIITHKPRPELEL